MKTRAVLDVNVLLSAVIGPEGIPRRIWLAWQLGIFTLVTSEPIIAEMATKLRLPRIARRYAVAVNDGDLFVLALRTQASSVAVLSRDVRVVTGDPEDDAALATARLGQAGYLVTGDRGLLGLSSYEGVQIVTRRAFWEHLGDRRSRGAGA